MRRLRIAFVVAVCLPWGAGSGLASGERIGEGSPQTPHNVTAPSGATNLPFFTGITDASSFNRAMEARLAHARALLGRLIAFKGTRTIANTLRPYDDMLLEADAVGSQAQLTRRRAPRRGDAARGGTDVTEGQRLRHGAVAEPRRVRRGRGARRPSPMPKRRYYVKRTLRDFHLAGVDKDEATRSRIQALRDELVVIGQDFDRNIRTDLRTVTAASAAELDGLPRGLHRAPQAGRRGAITLTIDYPDSLPVFSYATNEGLRKRMYMEYQNRAYPANIAGARPDDRASARSCAACSASTIGRTTSPPTRWSESAANASAFIDRVVAASGPKAEARVSRRCSSASSRTSPARPASTAGSAATTRSSCARRATTSTRSRCGPYFPFDRVKQGLLDVTGRLFGVTYRPLSGAPVWDPSVEAYEMLEHGKVVGRFYLDMHPRPNKYNHAAEFGIRTGVEGRQIPEAALVCNLPGGEPGDPGLMTHDDVVTFFHEFGHLVHALLARPPPVGRHRRHQHRAGLRRSAVADARGVDAGIRRRSRRSRSTTRPNEPIPAALVKQMRRASEFGKALGVRQQMVYARLSLSIYDRDPKPVDTTAMVEELTEQVHAVSVRRGHALPDVVRSPRRLLGGLLHVHVVAGHREGSVQPVRSRATCSRRQSRASIATRCSRPAARSRRPRSSATSSAGRSISRRGRAWLNRDE